MARIRSIKPSFFRSEDVAGLSYRARLTWIGLWLYADDEGRLRDDARFVKGDLWALEDDVTWQDVEADLTELATHDRIVRYVVDRKRYLQIQKWHEHQAIPKATASKLPAPSAADSSTAPSTPLQEDAGSATTVLRTGSGDGSRSEEVGEGSGEGESAHSAPPRKRGSRIPDPFIVTADMRRWARDEVPAADVDRSTRMFVDHWRSATGRNATKQDWIAAWRNWLRRDTTPRPGPAQRESSLDRRDRQRDQMFADLALLDQQQGALEA